MKRTPIKQIGKIGRANAKANRKIEKSASARGLYFCEVCEVLHEMGLLNWQCLQAKTNAHRHGRVWYRSQLDKLGDIEQWVFACIKAHDFIDDNTVIREEVFLRLRGKE